MNQKLIREIGRSQRLDIVLALKRRGGMSVKELAALFGMSYMGVKDHCLALAKEGYLDTWRRPKPIGRPEMLYRLTPRAQGLFPGEHHALTLGVLEAVQQTYGPAVPTKILFALFQQKSDAYRARLEGGTLGEHAASLARLREDEGCLPELVPEPEPPRPVAPAAPPAPPKTRIAFGPPPAARPPPLSAKTKPLAYSHALRWRLTEYHSPIEELLRRYPIIARLEREMFERVLNCPVRREEQTLPGLYRCVFHLGPPL